MWNANAEKLICFRPSRSKLLLTNTSCWRRRSVLRPSWRATSQSRIQIPTVLWKALERGESPIATPITLVKTPIFKSSCRYYYYRYHLPRRHMLILLAPTARPLCAGCVCSTCNRVTDETYLTHRWLLQTPSGFYCRNYDRRKIIFYILITGWVFEQERETREMVFY